MTQEDVYIYQSADPHTAIPDWLPFCGAVSAEARNMAHAILVLSRGTLPPTRAEIAESLGVDIRTIQRWLGELRAAGALHEKQVGRRVLCIFRRPGMGDTCVTHDTCVTRPTDHPTNRSPDRTITHAPPNGDRFITHQDGAFTLFSEKPIGDPPVGDVGVDHSKDDSTTTTNRAPLKTELAKWMRHQGMGAARDFDDPELDYWTYRVWIEEKRRGGWEWRQIVSTLRDAPLDTNPSAALLASDQVIAGQVASDLASDDLASDDLASDDSSIEQAQQRFREETRQQLISSANKRPASYHGGKK